MRASVLLALIGSPVLVVGCSAELTLSEPSSSAVTAQQQGLVEIGGKVYMPVGRPVPVGDSIIAPPEPFNPRKHTLRASTVIPLLNEVGNSGVLLPPRWPRGDGRGQNKASWLQHLEPAPGNGDFGLDFSTSIASWKGLYSVHDVGHNVVLPVTASDTLWLYAPTLLSPGYTCLETTTIHYRLPGASSTTKHYQGWFDWCESGSEGEWIIWTRTDSAGFTNPYVRTYYGQPTMALAVYKYTATCWTAIIYNYTDAAWDQLSISCPSPSSYSPAGADGWSYWESFDLLGTGQCPVLENIRALNINFMNPQDEWEAITDNADDVSESVSHWCLVYGPYDFVYPGNSEGLPANSWLAKTNPPNPLSVSISGPTSVGPYTASCSQWTASVSGGSSPFTYDWDGMFTGTGSSVTGTVPGTGGYLYLTVFESSGMYTSTSLFVTYNSQDQSQCQ